ncbi:ATP-binding protein [Streptomyces sp. NEAU-sy36]|uniref:ATP-binding protein n=1 Tax=unclassified Streptomyces TaxID=2593676 RepID=UPI0015D61554|nr:MULTISPECIES: ATP-binding protein [unclassified Streptomyces]QLJ00195.1 ATP-binding protein [Streptomyces sp. NEAU-sy36]
MPYEPSADWQYEVPTNGSKRLPPAARYVQSLTHQGYGFEAAIADLIDNSIDAGASKVVVSFLRDANRLLSLLVIDDGHGMDEAGLDVAMTVGGQASYAASALGHFGAGLKAASLSHADALTVISRTRRSPSAGRRWRTSAAEADFSCDIVDARYCQDLVDRYDGIIEWHGTIVRWDGVRAFDTVTSGQADRFLNEAIEKLETHLGLYLHRFLSQDDFHIDIVVEDVNTREELDHRGIEPIDPFGYRVSGRSGYPRTYTAPIEGVGDMTMTAHVWPPKSPLVAFRGIGPLAERQGFYIYRHNRLVQAGGWNGTRSAESHHSLARIAIDLPVTENEVFSLTVKKDGVNVTPAFARGLEKAADAAGRSFTAYLHDAETTYREAARRSTEVKRPEVIPPGKGVDPKLKRTLRDELPQMDGEDPITFRWESLPPHLFFAIDRDEHVVRLNREYRQAFNGDRRAGSNDAPVLKGLLYLMLEKNFRMGRSSAQRDDEMALWNSVLITAARCEMARYETSAD